MVQDTHTRTEKYRTWKKAQRCHIRSRKRTAPHMMMTDVPTGQGFGYPPQIFTNPTYAATITHTESEGEVKQERKFLGSIVNFVTNAMKHIAGVILPIGKRD